MNKIQKSLYSLGLSKLEAEVFTALISKAGVTAREISKKINRPVESVSRVLNGLQKRGLVSSHGRYPKKFWAPPLELAVNRLILEFEAKAEKIAKPKPLSIRSTVTSFVNYIPNRRDYHKLGEAAFRNVQKEILGIASGTGDFTPDLFRAMTGAVRRGVTYKVIAMTLDESNINLLNNWKNNGIQVRYRRGKGFNLLIFDRSFVQLGLRIMEDSREKVGFVIKNRSLAEFLGEFFDFLWERSAEIPTKEHFIGYPRCQYKDTPGVNI